MAQYINGARSRVLYFLALLLFALQVAGRKGSGMLKHYTGPSSLVWISVESPRRPVC